ncbi:MAG: PD40 domain-containing protein [Chloroflexi bacterium]|nr:PD40 domain-containing protein [Chloroflexota bacterium]
MKLKSFFLFALILLALGVIGCQATPTPTPRPTVAPPPTVVPLPTITSTRVPVTNTPAATATATQVRATLTPTRTPVLETPTPEPTATPAKPSGPTGSVLFFTKGTDGNGRLFYVKPDNNQVTPFLAVGSTAMDLALDGFGTNAHFGEFSTVPIGAKFAFVHGDSFKSDILRIIDVKSSVTRDIHADGGISSPTWSPDGKRIAFIRFTTDRRTWAISIMNEDGSSRADIRTNTSGEQYRGGLSWSKLNQLTFAMNSGGAPDVYTLFTDGGSLRNLTNNPAEDTTPVWSPDGTKIVFVSQRDGLPQIYIMNADGTGLRRLSDGTSRDFSPTWSPEGNWIGFASTRNFSTDIYMMDFNGANLKRLANGDHPVWSR